MEIEVSVYVVKKEILKYVSSSDRLIADDLYSQLYTMSGMGSFRRWYKGVCNSNRTLTKVEFLGIFRDIVLGASLREATLLELFDLVDGALRGEIGLGETFMILGLFLARVDGYLLLWLHRHGVQFFDAVAAPQLNGRFIKPAAVFTLFNSVAVDLSFVLRELTRLYPLHALMSVKQFHVACFYVMSQFNTHQATALASPRPAGLASPRPPIPLVQDDPSDSRLFSYNTGHHRRRTSTLTGDLAGVGDGGGCVAM